MIFVSLSPIIIIIIIINFEVTYGICIRGHILISNTDEKKSGIFYIDLITLRFNEL